MQKRERNNLAASDFSGNVCPTSVGIRMMGWRTEASPAVAGSARRKRLAGKPRRAPTANSRAPGHSHSSEGSAEKLVGLSLRAMRALPTRELNWKATVGLVERESDKERDMLQGWAREPGKMRCTAGFTQMLINACFVLETKLVPNTKFESGDFLNPR